MAEGNASDGAVDASRNDEGVLANLPRTRPQRSSPRRAAARASTAAREAPAANRSKPRSRPQTRGQAHKRPRTCNGATAASRRPLQKRRAASPKRPFTPIDDPAPRQGFECDGETTSGSVQPPGGAELVASAAEIVGELAKAGLSTGERLLKDVVSRLPLS